MSIYTKTGDKGKTSLRSGVRVWKDSLRVDTYGTIDELNSILGIISAEIGEKPRGWRKYLKEIVLTVQNDLLYIGSKLAQSEVELKSLDSHTAMFEREIDQMTAKMSRLANFILPGGGKLGAYFHHARTVVRRAERKVVSLARKEEVDEALIRYINRLSDLFFTMARFSNFKEKKKDLIWKVKK